MRKLAGLAAVVACLLFASAASASCRHPAHEPHGGPVYPLVLESFISENEWYFQPREPGAEPGCFYILETSVGGIPAPGTLGVWSYPSSLGFNPDIAPDEEQCYRLISTEDQDGPRFSNWLCIVGFEGERV